MTDQIEEWNAQAESMVLTEPLENSELERELLTLTPYNKMHTTQSGKFLVECELIYLQTGIELFRDVQKIFLENQLTVGKVGEGSRQQFLNGIQAKNYMANSEETKKKKLFGLF